eukprot:4720-Pleurochrysis_carterae.AAC.2
MERRQHSKTCGFENSSEHSASEGLCCASPTTRADLGAQRDLLAPLVVIAASSLPTACTARPS